MVAEQTQELGRRGVATIKRWLEATTFLELPFDAYNNKIDCTVKTCTAHTKCFDLSGYYVTGAKDPVRIECKNYSTPGAQYTEFQQFLAIAYGSMVHETSEYGMARNTHFLWVTYHPFHITSWRNLESPDEMREAAKAHPELAGEDINEALLTDVSSRVGIFVFNKKQEQLSLTSEELQRVRVVLKRKADTI